MINIANKRYDDRDFINDLNVIVDDIPSEVIEDADDLFSAVTEGLKVNNPTAFAYLKQNHKRLHKILLGVFQSFEKRHKRNFANSGDYMSYFRDKLKEWGVSSPAKLS